MEKPVDLDLKKEFIKRQACFAKLTDDEMEKLAALLTEQQVAAGETIVTESDPVDSIYLIVKGKADVRHVTIKDHLPVIKSVASLGPGNSIGLNETGLYSLSGVRTATVVAISGMVLLRLSLAQFHGFALANSHVHQVMHENPEAMFGKS